MSQVVPKRSIFNEARILLSIQQGECKTLDLSSVSKQAVQKPVVLSGHTSYVHCVGMLPTGEVVSGSADKTLRVWNTQTGECIQTIDTDGISKLVVLPTGEVVSVYDNTLKVWDPLKGVCLRTISNPEFGLITKLLLLPTGNVFAANNEECKVWNPQTGVCEKTFSLHNNNNNNYYWETACALLPTGEVVCAGYDLRVINHQTGNCTTFPIQSYGNVGVLPTGDVVTKSLEVWNPQTGKKLNSLVLRAIVNIQIEVLPMGEVVVLQRNYIEKATCLVVIQPLTGKQIQIIGNDKSKFTKIGVLPTGGVVSGSDKKLQIWDPLTGKCLQSLTTDSSELLKVLPTGEVISGGADRTLSVWKLTAPLTYYDLTSIFNALIQYPGLEHLNLTGVDLRNSCAYHHLYAVIRAQPQLQTLILEKTGLNMKQQNELQNLLLLPSSKLYPFGDHNHNHHGDHGDHDDDLSSALSSLFLRIPPINVLSVDVPKNYLCPITHHIMRNPVLIEDGHTYEEEAIRLHFETSQNSPITGAPLSIQQVFPNHALRSMIHEFLEKYPEFYDDGQKDFSVFYSFTLQKKLLKAIEMCDSGTILSCMKEDSRLVTRLIEGDYLLGHILKEQKPELLLAVLKQFTHIHWSRIFADRPLEMWMERLVTMRITSPSVGECLLTYFLDSLEKLSGGTYPALKLIEMGLEHQSRSFLEVGFKRLGGVNSALDCEGNTALHQAASKGDKEMVSILLELGANVRIKNKIGQKPRDLAQENGHLTIEERLIDAKIIPTLRRMGFFEQFPQFRGFSQI